ncbi:hypothetical protein BZG36_01066 [Bifiguratus adelaidae]|uniref:SWIRM domain-containing protein n=1 Tax=Bifiguratus adelaidae TaxID=1938954 RepID=A0A261Y664_9FUNG|nr:hypothetical protein BZG36_01066 [Bifiguratus adelaidae]
MSVRHGGPDLEFYQKPNVQALFDNICSYIQAELRMERPDFTLTGKEAAEFVGNLQQFQEDALGLSPKYNIPNRPLKIPAKIFKCDERTPYKKPSPMHHLLLAAYQFRIRNNVATWDFGNVDQSMALIWHLRTMLIKSRTIRVPRISFAKDVASSEKESLKPVVIKLGGTITTKTRESTHILHALPDDDDMDEEWFRTLEKRDGKVLVHWWYYPDSYDQWLPQSEQFIADPEDPPEHTGAWHVSLRWLKDSQKFNEWMNEEDYEENTEQDQSATPQNSMNMIHTTSSNYAEITPRHRAYTDTPDNYSPSSTMDDAHGIRRNQYSTEPDDAITQPVVRVVDIEISGPRPGARTRRNEFEPIPGGELSNISWEGTGFAQESTDGMQPEKRQREESPFESDDDSSPAKKVKTEEDDKTPQPQKPKNQLDLSTLPPSTPSLVQNFSRDAMSDLESRLVSNIQAEWPNLNDEDYLSMRNNIIDLFHYNTKRYLTIAYTYRHLNCDLLMLWRIYAILEHLQYINYGLEPTDVDDFGIVDHSDKDHLTAAQLLLLRKQVYDRTNPAVKNTFLSDQDDLDPFDEDQSFNCTTCQDDCSFTRYHSLKQRQYVICPSCFFEGRFALTHSSADFLRVEGGVAEGEGEEWTDAETLLLLEGVEKYDDEWNLVAEFVGTRTKEQCMMQFLSLPVEDGFLKSDEPDNDAAKNSSQSGWIDPNDLSQVELPFLDTPNPIMNCLAFLASAINPGMAGAAAKAALREIMRLHAKGQLQETDAEDAEERRDMSVDDVQPEQSKMESFLAENGDINMHDTSEASSPIIKIERSDSFSMDQHAGTPLSQMNGQTSKIEQDDGMLGVKQSSMTPEVSKSLSPAPDDSFIPRALQPALIAHVLNAAANCAIELSNYESNSIQRNIYLVLDLLASKLGKKMDQLEELDIVLAREITESDRLRQGVEQEVKAMKSKIDPVLQQSAMKLAANAKKEAEARGVQASNLSKAPEDIARALGFDNDVGDRSGYNHTGFNRMSM